MCPTRFAVDSMESSNIGGGVAEVWVAPRLVYDSAFFFETCIHVYVRTTYDQICPATIKINPQRQGLGMDIHVDHVCKSSGPSLTKRRGHIDFCAENMRILGSCL